MDELIGRIAEKLSFDAPQAERATGTLFALLEKYGGQPETRRMMDALPGAAGLARKYPAGGGLMAKIGGAQMAAFASFSAIGLDTGQIKTLGREVLAYAREKAGEETVAAVLQSIPGLGEYL